MVFWLNCFKVLNLIMIVYPRTLHVTSYLCLLHYMGNQHLMMGCCCFLHLLLTAWAIAWSSTKLWLATSSDILPGKGALSVGCGLQPALLDHRGWLLKQRLEVVLHMCIKLQSLELLKEKQRKFLRGPMCMPHPPPPPNILKVETKICAIWGILEAYLKKSSTLKFLMNIGFVPSTCIHRSIILIFIEKKKDSWWSPPPPPANLSNGKYFIPWFSIFISARILVSTTTIELSGSELVERSLITIPCCSLGRT